MFYRIYTTPEFDRLYDELPNEDKKIIDKLTQIELPNNPFQGRALGFNFFREKRIKGKRVYFLIYESYVLVLMISIGDKKTQKKDIAQIRMNRDLYLKLAKDLSNSSNISL